MAAQQIPDIERARDALRLGAWAEAYEVLRAAEPSSLSGADLDGLADAAWWVSKVDESLTARREAYSAHLTTGAARRAARTAWHLAIEFGFRGDHAVANGWVQRAKRDLADEPACVEHGYLAIAESHLAQERGDLDQALTLAERATDIGRRHDDRDLAALGTQSQGRLLIAQGRVAEGRPLLDEAMTAVIAGELSSLVTGWIYCQVVWACLELADLERAGAWAAAAERWCENLSEDAPYPGMCRLNRVELIGLRGMLAEAEAEAHRASEQLMAYEPYLAGEALYAVGEIRRRRGDLVGAEEAFGRAHELGREPQPGLALVRVAQGRAAEAATALGLLLGDVSGTRLGRARFLAAQVEVALAAHDVEAARAASDELTAIARDFGTPALEATAASARGRMLRADGAVAGSVEVLRHACRIWQRMGAPYEAAEVQLLLGRSLREAGDEESARRELQRARDTFARLGASRAFEQAAASLGAPSPRPGGLTEREVEVLRLVAAGRTNRDVAGELFISEHTVGRHLQNIFAKLGVSSRAAAASFAVEHELT